MGKELPEKLTSSWWRIAQSFYWLAIVLFIGSISNIMSNAEGTLIFIIFSAAVSIFLYQVLKKLARYINKLTHGLEAKKSWRITNVIYWLILLIIIIVSALYNDSGNYPFTNLAVLLLVLALPLYLALVKLYKYVTTGQ